MCICRAKPLSPAISRDRDHELVDAEGVNELVEPGDRPEDRVVDLLGSCAPVIGIPDDVVAVLLQLARGFLSRRIGAHDDHSSRGDDRSAKGGVAASDPGVPYGEGGDGERRPGC